MNFSLLARDYRGALIQSRLSPISRPAIFLTCLLATIGVSASIATKFMITCLPNMLPLVIAVMVVDVSSQFTPRTRIAEAVHTVNYGILFLVTTSLCGAIAAYAMQRFAFPLQDQNLASFDAALGLDWAAYVHWVDQHFIVQQIFHFAYHTVMAQIALPLVVLAFASRLDEVRVYLVAFALAFAITIAISALMPAAGPIVAVDRSSFHLIQFTGATPLDHLMMLRASGPLILNDVPGGIATFPSFHATIAILTPLTLRRFPLIFVALLILDAAMLGSTVSEGAHYFTDLIAGSCVAFLAYGLAKFIVKIEDRSIQRNSGATIGRPYPQAC